MGENVRLSAGIAGAINMVLESIEELASKMQPPEERFKERVYEGLGVKPSDEPRGSVAATANRAFDREEEMSDLLRRALKREQGVLAVLAQEQTVSRARAEDIEKLREVIRLVISDSCNYHLSESTKAALDAVQSDKNVMRKRS